MSAQQATCVHPEALFVWKSFHNFIMFDAIISFKCSWRKCLVIKYTLFNCFYHFLSIQRKCTPEGFDMSSAFSCFNGTNATESFELLKAYGDVTNTIDLSFVPSIEIDNVSFPSFFLFLFTLKAHLAFRECSEWVHLVVYLTMHACIHEYVKWRYENCFFLPFSPFTSGIVAL